MPYKFFLVPRSQGDQAACGRKVPEEREQPRKQRANDVLGRFWLGLLNFGFRPAQEITGRVGDHIAQRSLRRAVVGRRFAFPHRLALRIHQPSLVNIERLRALDHVAQPVLVILGCFR